MQDAALQTLVLKGLLDADAFTCGLFAMTAKPLPADLTARIADSNLKQHDLMEFLCVRLDNIPYDGVNGLKHRTHLGEYRYDIV